VSALFEIAGTMGRSMEAKAEGGGGGEFPFLIMPSNVMKDGAVEEQNLSLTMENGNAKVVTGTKLDILLADGIDGEKGSEPLITLDCWVEEKVSLSCRVRARERRLLLKLGYC